MRTLLVVALFLIVTVAHGSDGCVEISQASLASPPLVIDAPGSYVLTENLLVASNSTIAIRIGANNVTTCWPTTSGSSSRRTGNFIAKNTCRGNGTNYVGIIRIGNTWGPLVGGMTNHPWANFGFCVFPAEGGSVQ